MTRFDQKTAEFAIEYIQVGDVLLPNLTLDVSTYASGKWSRLRKQHLETHRKGLYSCLLLSGKLPAHLDDVQRSAEQRLETIIAQMAKDAGVDEALKAANQMEWVRSMNGIRVQAEEIILHELIYEEDAV